MTEHGLYIIKKEYLELVKSLGGDCDYNNGDKRPIYCCIKDNKIEKMATAIPLAVDDGLRWPKAAVCVILAS